MIVKKTKLLVIFGTYALENAQIYTIRILPSFSIYNVTKHEAMLALCEMTFLRGLIFLCVAQSALSECLDSLRYFIYSNLSAYQITIVSDNSYYYNLKVMDHTSKMFSRRFPTVSVDRSVPIDNSFNMPASLETGQPNTLFVIISSSEFYTRSVLDHLYAISWPIRRHKILLIHHNSNTYGLLEYAWKKQFTDVTLLQIGFNVASLNKLHASSSFYAPTIAQFNGFFNIYSKSHCNAKTIWFPVKTNNLNGRPLRVDLANDPPFCNLERNLTGHVIAKSGLEVMILGFISQGMNSRLDVIPRVEKRKINPFDDIDLTDLIRNLEEGRIDLIGNSRTL